MEILLNTKEQDMKESGTLVDNVENKVKNESVWSLQFNHLKSLIEEFEVFNWSI